MVFSEMLNRNSAYEKAWNAAEPARAMGARPMAVRRHLDVLSDAMMVRQLQPWFANIRKRQVIKAPKIYIHDSGLLHQLLGIRDEKDLLTHPKVGTSWEGFVIEQVLQAEPHDEAFFWSTHQGAEIDLILRREDALYGIECKFADAPRVTPSIPGHQYGRSEVADCRCENHAAYVSID